MVVSIDPETRQRVVTERHTGDINYLANTNTTTLAVAQETIPVVGDWEDYTGSGKVASAQQQNFAGDTNVLLGTTAQVEGGAKLPVLGIVGQRAQTTRRRTRLINRETDKDGKIVTSN